MAQRAVATVIANLVVDDPCVYRLRNSEGVELIWHAFEDMKGGEIYVKKIPSMKVTDVALAVNKEARQEEVGVRPGEKLHEQMIGLEDAFYTYEYSDYFKILPSINEWHNDEERIGQNFFY